MEREPLIQILSAARSAVESAEAGSFHPLIAELDRALQQLGKSPPAQDATFAGPADELRRLLTQLRALEQAKLSLFWKMGNQLREPLAQLVTPIQKLLRDEQLSPAQRNALDRMHQGAAALLRLVTEMLELSRLEAGQAADYSECDLVRLVRGVVDGFEPLARERRIELRLQLPPPPLPAHVDVEKIERTLAGCLAHALRHAPERGLVRCSLKADSREQRAVIEVADDGAPLPDELQATLFERYEWTPEPDGPAAPANGGLALAREFVRLHRGTIRVSDAPEGGAMVTVELPLRAPPNQPVRPAVELTPPAVDPALLRPPIEGERPLVLIVEDNAQVASYLAKVLKEDCRTVTARDGREGLEKARALRPDLVLTDLMMPGLSGEELLLQLRSEQRFEGVPVLILTGLAETSLRVRLLNDGALDYMTKPFHPDELQARVRNQLRAKRARDVLQQALQTRGGDLESLARELRSRQREAELALEAMQSARLIAEDSSRSKEVLLSMISHEFATPLQAMRLNLDGLDRMADQLGEGALARIRRIGRSVARLIELVESLLEYRRFASGRVETQRVPVDLSALATDVVSELHPLAEAKGLELTVRGLDGAQPLPSDPQLLRIALSNLVSNALKYTPRGSVEVVLAEDPEAHRLLVRDTGIGIAPEKRLAIFEPFTQLESLDHKKAGGVGLGLFLVRQILRALGGRIELSSQLGKGSTFTITLPRPHAH
jgi:signal transduction histidine kinase